MSSKNCMKNIFVQEEWFDKHKYQIIFCVCEGYTVITKT